MKNISFGLHQIKAIECAWTEVKSGGGFLDLRFTDRGGEIFELTVHTVDRNPLPIQGADLLCLMAAMPQNV